VTDEYPELPEEAIPEGWELQVRSEDTLFRVPGASVVGRTILYGGPDSDPSVDVTRPASETAGNPDDLLIQAGGVWRFLFATALSFRPPLAPWIGPSSVYPMVISEAGRAFGNDLRARGFEDVDREHSERLRVGTGDRGRLSKYTATLPAEAGPAVEIEGWLGVWTHEGSFRVVGGAHPVSVIGGAAEGDFATPETDPDTGREQLLGMIRAVR